MFMILLYLKVTRNYKYLTMLRKKVYIYYYIIRTILNSTVNINTIFNKKFQISIP